MGDTATIQAKYQALSSRMDEATLRIWAAAEARSLGRGGVSLVAKAIGVSRTTIHAGLAELKETLSPIAGSENNGRRRARAAGGGRKKLTSEDANLVRDLDRLIEPSGDPMSLLRWTCKSTRRLAEELMRRGHVVSQRTICDLLRQMHYNLQSTRKAREGAQHEDRDAQFSHIAKTVAEYQTSGDPVISVGTKKKEFVGGLKKTGQECQPEREPEEVRLHDFANPKLGKVAPCGVFDLASSTGWVSVDIDRDTSKFAVESIRRWWREMGAGVYPQARRLLIAADRWGNNGYRMRLWHGELQKLADELRLTIQACHFPPGTSKWNKIEHRMFFQITTNWRDHPLVSREVVINLIGSTTPNTGLRIKSALDNSPSALGIKLSDKELATPAAERDEFRGEWNYRLRPRSGCDPE